MAPRPTSLVAPAAPAPRGAAEDALRRIVEGTAAATGRDFFRALVRHLAAVTGFRHAVVGELLPGPDHRVRTLAAWDGGGGGGGGAFTADFEYALRGTPCENVVGRGVCHYDRDVWRRFPDDAVLAAVRAETYLGVAVADGDDAPLGVLLLMHDEPAEPPPFAAPLLQLFAHRCAAELRRGRAERALRESRHRYRSLADSSPVGIFHVDADGHNTYVNARAAEITGVPPEESHGLGWSRHLHPDDRDRIFAEWQDAVARGGVFRSEYRFTHPGGRVVWTLGEIHPERDAGGRLIGYVGTNTDITDRKLAEQAHRDGGARLRLLVEQVPAILWTTDRDLRFTSSLGSGLAPLGQSPDQFNGVSIYEFFATSDVRFPPIAAHLDALAGRSGAYEAPVMGRTYQCHVEPLRDPAGAVTGVAGVALDITERKGAEEALRRAHGELEGRVRERTAQLESANAALRGEVAERRAAEGRLEAALVSLRQNEQRLSGILNTQQTLVSRSDADGRITYVNDAHARIFGSKVGDSVLVRVHPEDVEQTVAAMESLARPPYTCALEQRVDVRGEWRTFLWQVGVIRDDAGRVAEYQAVGFDITDRRRAAEALRASERRARELARRERESAERERHAARQAREAAEFSRRLVREVDHRVRNNLAGLLGLVQAMRDKGAGVQDFAHGIEGRLLAMSNVHHLLADAGWEAVALRALVTSLLAAVERMGCHPIPVTVEGPPVSVSPRQAQPLSMILLEWFTNSCKYGAHSVPAGRVRVTWEVVPQGGRQTLRLRWQESDGPPVHAPGRGSLGTDLVHGFASLELKGRCELRYPASGADHVMEIPLE